MRDIERRVVRKGSKGPISGVISAALLVTTLGVGVVGCKSDQPQVTAVSDTGPDPAEANMAPVDASDAEAAATGAGLSPTPAGYGSAAGPYAPAPGYRASSNYRAAGYRGAPQGTVNQSQQAAQDYGNGQQAAAPVERQQPQGYPEGNGAYDNGQGNAGYDNGQNAGGQYGSDDAQALSDQIYQDVDPNQQAQEPPPPLPVYDQPPAPADDYLWTPGYWGYAPAGYYWVPGAWCAAPYAGALWTPGWWGPYGRGYGFHRGYWGRHIGFYGGVPYGFGYFGTGYYGGYWSGNHFAYNRAVSNVNITNIHNVYNRTVIVNNIRINNSVTNRYVNNTVINNRVSYNGGRGGIQARPVPAEMAAFRSQRTAPMSAQIQNQRAAETNRGQFFRQNQGRPVMATAGRVLAADRVTAPPVNNQPVRFGAGAANGVRQGVVAPGGRPGQAAGLPGQVQERPGQVPLGQQRGFEQPQRSQQTTPQQRQVQAGQTQPLHVGQQGRFGAQRSAQVPTEQQRTLPQQTRAPQEQTPPQRNLQVQQQQVLQQREQVQQRSVQQQQVQQQREQVQQQRSAQQQQVQQQREQVQQQRSVQQQQVQPQRQVVPQQSTQQPQPQREQQVQPQRTQPQARPEPRAEAPHTGQAHEGSHR